MEKRGGSNVPKSRQRTSSKCPQQSVLPKKMGAITDMDLGKEYDLDRDFSLDSEELDGKNPLLQTILSGDIEQLERIFEDPEEPLHSRAMSLIMKEDAVGRNLLFTACIAGQSNVIRTLAKYGVNLNEKTTRGYTLLHSAAAWGRLDTLKVLVDLEVDLDVLNFLNETARDIALRYSKMECVDYLDFAAAQLALKKAIAKVQGMLLDPEKGQGKLSREDKNLLTSACRSKSEWLELHPNATVEELVEQKQQLEDIVNPVFLKMTTPRKY
ncbi:ankyrin repeat domain-containing protein 45 [Gracilinanus agilis]|uniref:ankyrin repeat domain-containing protein 45 n=1 Tax=Gracilinanus agilis TaxID=191870 RepID=UPI001CFD5E8B|nr:ankyrin repeat domain-containing protein 45 [Gracilinanus agilis]